MHDAGRDFLPNVSSSALPASRTCLRRTWRSCPKGSRPHLTWTRRRPSRPFKPWCARRSASGLGAAGPDAPSIPGATYGALEERQRSAYLDPRGSEGTRELRDTARRRRDAEEKLQQHLMEAKEHVPNEFHEHHGTGQPHAGSEHGQAEGLGNTGEQDNTGEDAGEES